VLGIGSSPVFLPELSLACSLEWFVKGYAPGYGYAIEAIGSGNGLGLATLATDAYSAYLDASFYFYIGCSLIRFSPSRYSPGRLSLRRLSIR
jgi:hypothetical protein